MSPYISRVNSYFLKKSSNFDNMSDNIAIISNEKFTISHLAIEYKRLILIMSYFTSYSKHRQMYEISWSFFVLVPIKIHPIIRRAFFIIHYLPQQSDSC